jgi:DNA-binding PadR family transcriptional regulator
VPSRSLQSDLTAITTLGLVTERPRHPYEMQRLIRNRGKAFVKGLPRSLYHAIDRLSKEGLVEAVETSRDGRRPERTLYAATDAGRHALQEWLTTLLVTPEDDPTTYYAALSLIAYLDPKEALAALRERLLQLELKLSGETARMHALTPMLPRLFMLEEEYRLAALAAERDYTAGLVDDLSAGRLTWDLEEMQRLAAESSEEELALVRRALMGEESEGSVAGEPQPPP